MKTLFLFVAISISFITNAQVTKVSLQASGLTCSMCSNSINKALKTLSFIDNINPDIQTSSFEITFKPGTTVDFDAIKKKVEDAGFSVAKFIATVDFKNVQIEPNKKISVGDKTFYFLNAQKQLLNGNRKVRLIDKGFVSNKEYKKNAAALSSAMPGVYYATMS